MDSRLLWGTVEMLILEVISRGPSYGYQISQTVLAESRGYFELKEGSLYPALNRVREVSAYIAAAVARVAYEQGFADAPKPPDLLAHVRAQMYDPHYPNYVTGA